MALLQTADVAKKSTFICGLANMMEEKINNLKFGIECNYDPSAKIKEINAYLWLIENSDCEITSGLYSAFKVCYGELKGSIYSCEDIGPCSNSEVNNCGLVATDINTTPPDCSLTSIEILK